MTNSQDVYEIRPRKDRRGVDLISDVLPFGLLWYAEPNAISNAVGYAKFFSRSHDAVIRVYDATAMPGTARIVVLEGDTLSGSKIFSRGWRVNS